MAAGMILIGLVLGAPLLAGTGCSRRKDGPQRVQPNDAGRFVRADVTLYRRDEQGRQVQLQKRVDDAEQIRRLAAFFPGAGTGRRSPTGGGWMTRVRVVFTRTDGTMADVGSDFTHWGEGLGEFPAEPGLEQHVRSLFDR